MMEATPDRFTQNLQNIAALLKKDWDWLVCIDGYERTGKSTLALQMCRVVDPNFDIDQVVFDWNDLKRLALELPRCSAIFYDEARMLTRERLKEWNIHMMQALSVIGFRNQFFIFNFPDFWELDPYIKDHRCRTRIYVSSYRGNRGFARIYVAKRYPFRSRSTHRSIWWDYSFTHRFSGYDQDDGWSLEDVQFWEEYRTREEKAKIGLIENPINDVDLRVYKNMKADGNTLQKIADTLGKSRRELSRDRSRWKDGGLID